MVYAAPRGNRDMRCAINHTNRLIVDSVRNVGSTGRLHGAGEAILPTTNEARTVECRFKVRGHGRAVIVLLHIVFAA